MEEHISHKAFIPWRFLTADCVLSFSLAPINEIIDILIACRLFFFSASQADHAER